MAGRRGLAGRRTRRDVPAAPVGRGLPGRRSALARRLGGPEQLRDEGRHAARGDRRARLPVPRHRADHAGPGRAVRPARRRRRRGAQQVLDAEQGRHGRPAASRCPKSRMPRRWAPPCWRASAWACIRTSRTPTSRSASRATVYEPDPAATKQYEDLFKIYKQLYPALQPVSQQLSARFVGVNRRPMAQYLMGIDNGLTVSKAAIFDLAGREVAVAGHKVDLSYPRPGLGRARHGSGLADDGRAPSARRSRRRASTRATSSASATRRTATASTCSTRQGAPSGPSVTSMDNRAQPTSSTSGTGRAGVSRAELPDRHDQHLGRAAGRACWPGSSATGPRSGQQIGHAFTCKDYIKYRLTGTITTDLYRHQRHQPARQPQPPLLAGAARPVRHRRHPARAAAADREPRDRRPGDAARPRR